MNQSAHSMACSKTDFVHSVAQPCAAGRPGDTHTARNTSPPGLCLAAVVATAPDAVRANPASPSLPFVGAYFPSWLICAALGIVGAIVLRVLLIRAGVDDALPARLLVYISLASAISFSLGLTVYGR